LTGTERAAIGVAYAGIVLQQNLGKSHSHAKVVREDLSCFSEVHKSIGVPLLSEGGWLDKEADMVMWTDASETKGTANQLQST